LGDLITHPVDYHDAQVMMCLDLYRDFDFNTMRLIAAPVKIASHAKIRSPSSGDRKIIPYPLSDWINSPA
jgi:hypothetical protein